MNRTVKRDVAALQQAGVPVWATAGPGGGYVLDAAATLPPVNLTPAQEVAVAVALSGAGDAPFAVDGRAALAKVLAAMGPAARAEVERLAGRVWVRGQGGAPPAGPAPASAGTSSRGAGSGTRRAGSAGTASRTPRSPPEPAPPRDPALFGTPPDDARSVR